MESLSGQLYAFIMTILAGVTLGFVFDFYRVIRGALNPGRITTALMDLGFWAISAPLISIYLLLANWGEIRFYVFIGISLGLLFYFLVFSGSVIALLMWIFYVIGKVISGVIGVVFQLVAVPISLFQDLFLGLRVRRTRFTKAKGWRFRPALRWRTNFLAWFRR